jgi:hypothetical protein
MVKLGSNQLLGKVDQPITLQGRSRAPHNHRNSSVGHDQSWMRPPFRIGMAVGAYACLEPEGEATPCLGRLFRVTRLSPPAGNSNRCYDINKIRHSLELAQPGCSPALPCCKPAFPASSCPQASLQDGSSSSLQDDGTVCVVS